MEKQYDKLVRDNIPSIIKEQGNKPIIRTLSDNEYIAYLNKKLAEEVNEYLENNCIEELCDILEVIKSVCAAMRFSDEEINTIKEEKVRKNGSFKNKLLLEKIIFD